MNKKLRSLFKHNISVTRVALRGEVPRRCEGVDTKCYNKVTMVVVMNLWVTILVKMMIIMMKYMIRMKKMLVTVYNK